MLTEIEQSFAQIEPAFTRELHKSIIEGKEMDHLMRDRLFLNYQTCFVGTIRDKLKLPKQYIVFEHKDRCIYCERYADMFMDDESSKNKENYLNHLRGFKEHLVDEHGKLL